MRAGCKPALPVLVQLIWRVGPSRPHEGVHMQAIWEDVRFGYRMLMKHRLVSQVCIMALALGIGANAAIFSMAEAFLLHPVPFENADRYIALLDKHAQSQGGGGFAEIDFVPIAPATYFDWKKQAKS